MGSNQSSPKYAQEKRQENGCSTIRLVLWRNELYPTTKKLEQGCNLVPEAKEIVDKDCLLARTLGRQFQTKLYPLRP